MIFVFALEKADELSFQEMLSINCIVYSTPIMIVGKNPFCLKGQVD